MRKSLMKRRIGRILRSEKGTAAGPFEAQGKLPCTKAEGYLRGIIPEGLTGVKRKGERPAFDKAFAQYRHVDCLRVFRHRAGGANIRKGTSRACQLVHLAWAAIAPTLQPL